ncbi:MAG: putative metal-binding motif-containing protein, partial [Myxococcota bacterium]|nr:putative metal-binding motif-containing protein [Myxococcota bacterium]
MNRSTIWAGILLLTLAGCSGGTELANPDTAITTDGAGGDAGSGVDGSIDPVTDAEGVPDSGSAAETATPDVVQDIGANPIDTLEDAGEACPGCFGSPCEDNDDCFSGWCVEGPDGAMCTKGCEETCPEGFECRAVASGASDPVYICIYAHLAYCRPCDRDADCAHPQATGLDSRCVAHGAEVGSFCATSCAEGVSCPGQASCQEVDVEDGTEALCLPGDGAACECSSWAIEVAGETSCAVTNEAGACEGVRTCLDDGLSPCEGQIPAAEACNGFDDDCDEGVDEDFSELGAACDGDDADLCEGGTWVCADDGTMACNDSDQPAAELCNGLDDDCDDGIDEDFADLGQACDGADVDLCTDGIWVCDGAGVVCEETGDLIELCNALDDDCDGETDEAFGDLGQACDGDDEDDCQFGTWSCADDGVACDEPELPELTMTDLDGTPDLALGDPCGVGACDDGSVTCGDDLITLACSTASNASDEACNGLDDDCDGVTDEDFAAGGTVTFTDIDGTTNLTLGENCGAGACTGGVVTCDAAGDGLACSTAEAAVADLCNGVDDDCDGVTDEDYAAGGTVTMTDPSSPEPIVLGDPCGVGLCAGGVVACAAEGTGLVCSTATSADEDLCDGLDNDCDGTTDEAYVAGGSFSLTDLDGTEGLTKGEACGHGACDGGVVVCGDDLGSLVCSTHDVVDVDVCDSVDNDCDGETDEAYVAGGAVTYDDPSGATDLVKGDVCGAGICDGGTVVCSADKLALVCSNAPEGGELCDDIDNDCDGETDEGCDDDLDGYCDVNHELIGAPAVCALGGGDCDDEAEFIHPSMTESCDDVDNNCTAGVDEGCDDDGDDFCDNEMVVEGTPAVCPAGIEDCNDDDPAIHGNAVELCDDIDNNCNGDMDEGCNDDSDGYCDGDMVTVGTPSVCVDGGGDCDDTRDDIYPTAPELCDDADNNCIDGVDEGCDDDGDGWCDLAATVVGA